MFNWFRRRRLSVEARQRLLLLAARADEAVVETHVANLLDLLETLADEIDLDQAIEIYSEMMSLDDSHASVVANRLLASLQNPTGRTARAARRYRKVFQDDTRH